MLDTAPTLAQPDSMAKTALEKQSSREMPRRSSRVPGVDNGHPPRVEAWRVFDAGSVGFLSSIKGGYVQGLRAPASSHVESGHVERAISARVVPPPSSPFLALSTRQCGIAVALVFL